MKKILQGVMLAVVLALGLTMSPAMAAAGSPQEAPALSAADQAFLAALATPVPAPELAARHPIVGKAGCSANCGWSGLISCPAGTTSCMSTDQNCSAGIQGSLTCNGTTTSCPACPTCAELQQQCVDNCGSCPIQTFVCSPYTCRCNTRSGFCT